MDKMAYDAMLDSLDHKEKYPEMYDKKGKLKRKEEIMDKAYCGKCLHYKNFGYMKGECHHSNNYKDTWFGEKAIVNETVKILNKNNDCIWYEEK